MDSVIAKIVELDKQAQSIKEKINEIESTNSQKLKNTLKELDSRAAEEAKKTGQEKYQDFVNEGLLHKEKISKEAKKECDLLEDLFKKRFQYIIDNTFNEIFKA